MGKIHVLNEDQGVFFEKQLQYLETEILKVQYPELMGRKLFSVDTSIPPGAKSGTYRVMDIRGKANWINGAAKDLPRVDLSGREVTYPIKPIGDSFGFDVVEIEAARMAGVNLETERSNAAAYVVEIGIDEAIFNGVSELGITGLLSNTAVPTAQAANNAGGTSRTWAAKTPDEILADINGMFTGASVDTNGIERPSKLGIPIAQYNDIATRRLGSVSDTTVLEYVTSKSPFLQGKDSVFAIPYFAGAGTLFGAGAVDVAMIWDPNPVKLQVKIPMDVRILSELADVQGLEIVTPVIARFGGLAIRFPKSLRKIHGI